MGQTNTNGVCACFQGQTEPARVYGGIDINDAFIALDRVHAIWRRQRHETKRPKCQEQSRSSRYAHLILPAPYQNLTLQTVSGLLCSRQRQQHERANQTVRQGPRQYRLVRCHPIW